MGFLSKIFGTTPPANAPSGAAADADKAKSAFEERVRKLI